jgi:hypothetical protein
VRRDRDRDAPQPEPRRKSGETDTGFIMAAAALCSIPVEAYEAARVWLADTLDWLNMWEANAEDVNLNEFDSEVENSDTNFPTLHL